MKKPFNPDCALCVNTDDSMIESCWMHEKSYVEVIPPASHSFAPQHCGETEPCVDDVYCNCACESCLQCECRRPGCSDCGKIHVGDYRWLKAWERSRP